MSLIKRVFKLSAARPVISEFRADAGDADATLGSCHCSNGPLKM